MTKQDLDQIVKIQLSQVQSMMTGQICDSYNRTLCAREGTATPTLYPPRKDAQRQHKANALDNALGRPTALSIKNPRPLLQMVSSEELAAARAEAEAEPGSPLPVKKITQGSLRISMMRTIEDCHACIVEYEDLKCMDIKDVSSHEKAEMRSLMHTLVDRVFSAFTAGVAGGADGDASASINDDVLVTLAGIAKGRRLVGRMIPLLEGSRKEEFFHAVLRNLARIVLDLRKNPSTANDPSEEEKLAEYLAKGCADLDLSTVRSQLVAAYQTCKNLDANNLLATRVGCAVVTTLVERGLQCLSIGKSEERSRSQWQAALKDLLMFCTMHCVALCGLDAAQPGTSKLGDAGSRLVQTVVKAFRPHMTVEQGQELSQCFSAQGLDPSSLGFD